MSSAQWLTVTGFLVAVSTTVFSALVIWNAWVTGRLVAIEDHWKTKQEERTDQLEHTTEHHAKYLSNIKAALKEAGIVVRSPRDSDSPIHIKEGTG